jgi:hypothetical protein
VTRDLSTVGLALLLKDGRGILVRTFEQVLVFSNPVPADFREAVKWLEQATNARNRQTTGALYWQ